jgi:hypothetical protein
MPLSAFRLGLSLNDILADGCSCRGEIRAAEMFSAAAASVLPYTYGVQGGYVRKGELETRFIRESYHLGFSNHPF